MIDYNQRNANFIITTKDKSQEARDFMASDPTYAYEYAVHVLKGRFLEGEKIIAKDKFWYWLWYINRIDGVHIAYLRNNLLKETNPPVVQSPQK